MPSSYEKTARATVFIACATAVQFLIGIFFLPILTKTLGAYGYGLWSQVSVTVNLILPFAALGLTIALVRYLASEDDRSNIQEGFYSILFTVFFTSAVISSLILIFSSYIAGVFFDGNVDIVRLTAGIILASSIEPLYLNLIRTFQQIKKYSIFIIAEDCTQFGLITYMVLNGHGIRDVVITLLIIRLVAITVLFFMTKSQIGIKKPNFSRMKVFLRLSLPTIPRRVGTWLVNVSDRYIIVFYLGVSSTGIYSAGYGLGNIPYSMVSVLTFVLLAPLAKLYDNGKMDEVTTHLSYSLKYFLAIAIPFIFGAAILAEPVLELFSTPEIASQGYIVTPIIALAISILGVNNLISNILILVKKTKIMATIWVLAAVLNLGLNVLLVPRIGILGAALTTLIAYLLVLGLSTYFSFREFRFKIHWRFIAKSLISSMVMSAVVWIISPEGHIYTIVTVITGIVVYAVILIGLRGFSKAEYRFFISMFRRDTTASSVMDDGRTR